MLTVRRIVLGLCLLVAACIAVFGLVMPRGASTQPALLGTSIGDGMAPDFHLRDQFGRPTSLAQFRGGPVIVTFLESQCVGQCPIVAETLRRVLAELGSAGRRVGVVAVSTAPEVDTAEAVRTFSRQHGLLHRWHFVIGSRTQLARVWKAYYVYAAPKGAPAKVRDAHSAVTYLVDADDRRRILTGGVPSAPVLVRDLQILLGLPPGDANRTIPAPEVGHPAPTFTLTGPSGQTISLRSLRGKVVLLNFWATWCGPCRSEMPQLSAWYRQTNKRGVVVLGVDQQESRSDVNGFVGRLHVSYPIVLDSSGDVSAKYSIPGLPSTFVIDQNGIVEFVNRGIVDTSFLRVHVLPLLARS